MPHLLRQGQRPHEIGEIVCQGVKLEPYRIVAKAVTRQARPVVFYGGEVNDTSNPSVPFACAAALTWGFTRVYSFGGALQAWNKAGYPVETAQ